MARRKKRQKQRNQPTITQKCRDGSSRLVDHTVDPQANSLEKLELPKTLKAAQVLEQYYQTQRELMPPSLQDDVPKFHLGSFLEALADLPPDLDEKLSNLLETLISDPLRQHVDQLVVMASHLEANDQKVVNQVIASDAIVNQASEIVAKQRQVLQLEIDCLFTAQTDVKDELVRAGKLRERCVALVTQAQATHASLSNLGKNLASFVSLADDILSGKDDRSEDASICLKKADELSQLQAKWEETYQHFQRLQNEYQLAFGSWRAATSGENGVTKKHAQWQTQRRVMDGYLTFFDLCDLDICQFSDRSSTALRDPKHNPLWDEVLAYPEQFPTAAQQEAQLKIVDQVVNALRAHAEDLEGASNRKAKANTQLAGAPTWMAGSSVMEISLALLEIATLNRPATDPIKLADIWKLLASTDVPSGLTKGQFEDAIAHQGWTKDLVKLAGVNYFLLTPKGEALVKKSQAWERIPGEIRQKLGSCPSKTSPAARKSGTTSQPEPRSVTRPSPVVSKGQSTQVVSEAEFALVVFSAICKSRNLSSARSYAIVYDKILASNQLTEGFSKQEFKKGAEKAAEQDWLSSRQRGGTGGLWSYAPTAAGQQRAEQILSRLPSGFKDLLQIARDQYDEERQIKFNKRKKT